MAKISNLLACAALATVLAAPRLADAGPKEEARGHIDRATKAHKAGDLDRALKELLAAYGLDPQPQLLYAIGQIHTRRGECSEARDAYLRFLASGTDVRTAEVVKQAIDGCKPAAPPEPVKDAEEPPLPPAKEPPPVAKVQAPPKRVAAAPEPRAPAGPPMSDRTTPWYRDVLGDVLVVGGVASLVLGGLAYRAAVTDLDTAESVTMHETYDELVDGARTKRLVGVALAGGGAVLVTAGILRFMLRDSRAEVRRVGLAPARSGGLLTWTRSF